MGSQRSRTSVTERLLLSVKWMNLEPVIQSEVSQKPVIQSEVSQKEKNKYHKLTHIYGVKKNGTDEPICKAAVETQTQRTDRQTCEHNRGRREWDEWREQHCSIYITICKIANYHM